MRTNLSLLNFLVFIIFITACSRPGNSSLIVDIQNDIDSLAIIYAPDSRIELWNISIENNDDKISVMAEVANKKAKSDLLKTFSEKYPDMEIKVTLLPENYRANTINALVNNSVSSIRAEPSHKAEIVNQALLGWPLRIFKKEKGWYLVQTPNHYLGWINAEDIVEIDSAQLIDYQIADKKIFLKQYGFSYLQPDVASQTVTDLVVGCILPVVENLNGFDKVQYPDGRTAYVNSSELELISVIFNKEPIGEELVKTAKKFMGIPYLWGGFSSKAIDCSGFTSIIYFLNGYVLQRDASQQIQYGQEITREFEYKDLELGDLLFFGRRATDSLPEKVTHVGMYIGDSEFIHASGKVKINSMDSTRTNYSPGYLKRFIKTVRVIGHANDYSIQKTTKNEFYKNLISN